MDRPQGQLQVHLRHELLRSFKRSPFARFGSPTLVLYLNAFAVVNEHVLTQEPYVNQACIFLRPPVFPCP